MNTAPLPQLPGLLNSIPDGILVVDSDGVIQFANRAITTLFGYNPEELVGSVVEVLLPPQFRESHVGQRREYVAVPRVRAMGSQRHIRCRRKDGSEFPADIMLSPLADSVPPAVVAVVRDATTREEIEARLRANQDRLEDAVRKRTDELSATLDTLRESEERLLTVLSAIQEGLLYFDSRGKVLTANTSAARILGFSVNRLLGSMVEELPMQIWDEDSNLLHANQLPCVTARHSGEPKTGITLQMAKPDGSRLWVNANVFPVCRSGTPPYPVVCSFADITQQRQTEHDLRIHREDLEKVAKLNAVGEMAATLAHELSQPLMAVASFCQGIRLRSQYWVGAPPELFEVAEYAIAESRRAADIVRRLRDFIGKRRTTRQLVAVNDLIRDLMNLIRPEVVRYHTEARLSLAADLQPVVADRIQLEEVILNLVRNALEAMSTSPVGKRSLVIATEGIDGGVRIMVTDTGPGLRADAAVRLFEPFNTTKPHGMGLGLAICQRIVESHGGKIICTPEEQGVTFSFDLLPMNL